MEEVSHLQMLNSKLSSEYIEQSNKLISSFSEWSDHVQTEFINNALSRLSHGQLKIFDQIISPLLQKDIIANLDDLGLGNISARILSYLDPASLSAASQVSQKWQDIIDKHKIWKTMIENLVTKNPVWKKLLATSKYEKLFFSSNDLVQKEIYEKIFYKLDSLENILKKNWTDGNYKLDRICCGNDINRGVYCIQYDNEKIICGLRDNTIKVWSLKNQALLRVLKGHEGSVLCLQYQGDILISGSSDSTIRIWNHVKMIELDKIETHTEPVLHLKFNDDYLITCSKDYTISIFEIKCLEPMKVKLKQLTVLREHKAAVNVIDFDNRYLVSASGDRTIKVWQIGKFNCLQTLTGHRRGIACLQFHENLIISGSSDHTIRVWDISIGSCIRILFGHEELVRCIRFDSEFIISGAYDGKIKVWNLSDVVDKNTPHASLKATTLCEHTSRVFKLQFDSFKIVSSSQDDTILIWDFLGLSPEELEEFWDFSRPSKLNSALGTCKNMTSLSLNPSQKLPLKAQTNYPLSQKPSPSQPLGNAKNCSSQKPFRTSNCDKNPQGTAEEKPKPNPVKSIDNEAHLQKSSDDLTVNQIVDTNQRDNHPFSRMLRKCLSLKKTRKDQPGCFSGVGLVNSSSGLMTPSINNFNRLSTELLNQSDQPSDKRIESELFASSLSNALINSQLNTAANIDPIQTTSSPIAQVNPSELKLLKASNTPNSALMEIDSPGKEDSSDSRPASPSASKFQSFSLNEFDYL